MQSLVPLIFLATLLHLSATYTYYSKQHNDTVKHTSKEDVMDVKLSIREYLSDDNKKKKIVEALNSKSQEDLELLRRDIEKQATLKNSAAIREADEYIDRDSNEIKDEDIKDREGRIMSTDGCRRSRDCDKSSGERRRVVGSSERYREGEDRYREGERYREREDSRRPITLQVMSPDALLSIAAVPLLDMSLQPCP